MRTVDFKEQDLFLDAIEIEAPLEREQFLADRCGENVELRKRVMRLVELHGVSGFVLDDPASETLPEIETAREGQEIGPYRLIRRLGEGGMGSVWHAQQLRPVHRDVAIKIIKLGMDTRSVIARFQAERQALAMMDHPCITKVFDAGATESGRPYFVMELVEGVHITDYCDRHRLNLTQRLELFCQVCHAVQHAHQKGLIHRDIKPSNVLITVQDDQPLPKIIDFGIAKATHQRLAETTIMTQSVALMGTPEYMSPEQAELHNPNIDTRSDIYSLGVLLYELLTGSTPFGNDGLRQKHYHQICEIILTRQPDSPSTRLQQSSTQLEIISDKRCTQARPLCRAVQGELDWITLKCLSKDRAQRYDTAADVAREIERFLTGEPVEAAAPSFWYRATKFARKHRTAFAMTTLVALLLAIAVAISTTLAVKANTSADRAHDAEALAHHRLDEANRAWQSAEFERHRAKQAKADLAGLRRVQQNQLATARAIARFNAMATAAINQSTSDNVPHVAASWQVSSWMKQELGSHKRILLDASPTNPKTFDLKTDMQQVDAVLLSLMVEEQRMALSPQDSFIADTLDLLAEHALNTQNLSRAESHARQSLAIRHNTQKQTTSYHRSTLLLGQTLARQGKSAEARIHFMHVSRALKNNAEAPGLLKIAEHEIKLLDQQK